MGHIEEPNSSVPQQQQQNVPVQNIPVQNVPVQNTPVQNTPIQNTPVQNTPVQNDVPRQEVPVQFVQPQTIGKGVPLVQELPLPSDRPQVQQQAPINTSPIPLPLPLPTRAGEVPPTVSAPDSTSTSLPLPNGSKGGFDDASSTFTTFATRTSSAAASASTSVLPRSGVLPSPPAPVAQTSGISPAMQLAIGITVPMFVIVLMLLVAAFFLLKRQRKRIEHQKRYMDMAGHFFLGTRAFPAELPAMDVSRATSAGVVTPT